MEALLDPTKGPNLACDLCNFPTVTWKPQTVYALRYTHERCCFSVGSLRAQVRTNELWFLNLRLSDWLTLGLPSTTADSAAPCAKLRWLTKGLTSTTALTRRTAWLRNTTQETAPNRSVKCCNLRSSCCPQADLRKSSATVGPFEFASVSFRFGRFGWPMARGVASSL